MCYGLTLYLEKYKFGNANTEDLWKAMTAASHNSSHPVDVKVIMPLHHSHQKHISHVMYATRLSSPLCCSLMCASTWSGHYEQLDTPAGLPVGDAASPWQLDPCLSETLSACQLIRTRKLHSQVVYPFEFRHQCFAEQRKSNLDARQRWFVLNYS